MPRRRQARATVRRLALAVLLATTACGRPARPPDVVLVVVDTLRADYLGSYGFAHATSPNVDRLAERSVVWERALAASSLTVPSHASMMTSLFVRGHSVGHLNGGSRLGEEATLASLLRGEGYETAAFVSSFMLARRVGLDDGFDVYDDSLSDAEANRPWVLERVAGRTTDLALAWLSERGERPFFLWVHYQDPHGPYAPPSPHDESFPEIERDDPRRLPRQQTQGGAGGIPAYQVLPDLETAGAYKRRYAGEIEYFDAELGRLLSAVETRGRRTVILLTADHGESMGEANRFFSHGHSTTPDLVHVPFLISAPGLEPQRRRELVHHVDVMPTLLELVGIAPPVEATGIALGPFVRGDRALPNRVLFSDIGLEASAYRDDLILRMSPMKVAPGPQRPRNLVRTHRWLADGSLTPGEVDPEMRRELVRYLSDLQPVRRHKEQLSEEDRARLRALGYLESAGEAASPPPSPLP